MNKLKNNCEGFALIKEIMETTNIAGYSQTNCFLIPAINYELSSIHTAGM